MKQTTLFPVFDEQQVTRPAARRTDPKTSHAAAANYESSGNAASDREAILHVMRTQVNRGADGFPRHGWTSGELAAALGEGWTNVRCSRRLPEMTTDVVRGRARKCEEKGTEMISWHLVE